MQQNTIVLCIITKNDIKAETIASLMTSSSQYYKYNNIFYKPKSSLVYGQSDIPKARSRALTEWYKESKDGDLFLFIDSDQTFQPKDINQAITILHNNNAHVVSGGYCRFDGTVTLVPENEEQFKQNKYGLIKFSGCGFMLISHNAPSLLSEEKTLVKSDIKDLNTYTYFFPIIDQENRWLGEDYSFCYKIREKGGKVYGFVSDTIGHIIENIKYVNINNIYF